MLPLSTPEIKPFERLRVSDGLLINAERWQRAHAYHRDRQNVHYQSLNQPGVVWGLGVQLIQAPRDVPEQYWDERWIQIQPGLAIDDMGNPIVIPEPMDFRISSVPGDQQSITIYVVVRYVDPEHLENQSTSDTVRETFRIDEKNSPPTRAEVELCRLVLKAGVERVELASNVFAPGLNQLDLRYRVQAQARPTASIHVATVGSPKSLTEGLSSLLQATQGLYPTMQAAGAIDDVQLQSFEEVMPYDLLVMTDEQARSLSDTSLEVLHQFQAAGGVVLVESAIQGTQLEDLLNIQQQLSEELVQFTNQDTVESVANNSELVEMRRSISSELDSIKEALQNQLKSLSQDFQLLSPAADSLAQWNQILRHHPLRTQPFLFGALPTVHHQSIQLLHQDGLIVLLGKLSVAWQADDALSLSRETIRAAQELGINLLHYAWRRKHLTQLQGMLSPSQEI